MITSEHLSHLSISNSPLLDPSISTYASDQTICMVLICFLLDIFKINILYFMNFCLFSSEMTAFFKYPLGSFIPQDKQVSDKSFANVLLHVSVLNLAKLLQC